jgi:hypothetical protein
MDRKMILIACVMSMSAVLAGCCGTLCGPEPCEATPGQWGKSEVYFGRDLPGGGQISPAQWGEFLNKVITPRFPKGLTIYDAYGQMQHADGRIERQSTWVVVILHPQDPVVGRSVQEIIEAYRSQFNKAQVAYVTTRCAATSFYAD